MSDAVRAFSSCGVHPLSDEVCQILLDKHPQIRSDSPPAKIPQFLEFGTDEVEAVLKSFPNGTSGGPSGIAVQLFLDCLTCGQLKESLLQALAKFCELFAKGIFPIPVAQFYGGARLIPLAKKDGGVRPMAIGETLRRLTCKLMLNCIRAQVLPVFLPHQMGVGVTGGAEAIIHALAGFSKSLKNDEVILQVDFMNAFNMVNRNIIMEQVKLHFPSLVNLVNVLYANEGRLLMGKGKTFWSCLGVQQGCPLGALLFALVLNILIAKIKLKNPDLKLNLWYLDDGHIIGNVDEILSVLKVIEIEGPHLGLFLNLSKCVVYGSSLDEFPSQISRAYAGLSVLGVPVGASDFITKSIDKKLTKIDELMSSMALLDDPQSELLILRSCIGVPSFNYWLRSVDPLVIAEHVDILDSKVNQLLHHIIGFPLDSRARLLASLPLSLGGLGIPIAKNIFKAAYVSSYAQSWSLQPNLIADPAFVSASEDFKTLPTLMIKDCNFIPHITKTKEFSQHDLTLKLNGDLKKNLLENASDRLKTLITGRMAKGASSWLLAFPNIFTKSKFDKSSFQFMLKYSLGVPLFLEKHECLDCGVLMDQFGDHAVTCSFSSGRIEKHNSLVNVLYKKLKDVGVSCYCEAAVISNSVPNSESKERPGDLFITDFDIFGEAYFDVSVINMLCPSYLRKSSSGSLCGAEIRYAEKMKKYAHIGPQFKPLAVECTGGWHAMSFKSLKSISALIASRSNQATKLVLKNLLTSLSVSLQRHQGAMMVRRCLSLA